MARLLDKPPNGLRYLRVGGRGFCLGAGKNSKREKCSKMPQNPTRQVHALLGAVFVNYNSVFFDYFTTAYFYRADFTSLQDCEMIDFRKICFIN